MKTRNIKKLIVGLAFIAVAAIAAWNVSVSSNEYGLSDVSLANVEALARRESDGYYKALAQRPNGEYCCAPYVSDTCSKHHDWLPDCVN